MENIITSNQKILWRIKWKLREVTLWVKDHNAIYFVDIKKKKFFSQNTKTNKKKVFQVHKETCFLAHIKDYIFILGLQGELRIQNIKTKKVILNIAIKTNIKLNKINDGKTDPNGKRWVGTRTKVERKLEEGTVCQLDKKY